MLSTLDDLADERGVILPFPSTLLTGVFVCLTRGVGGSDLRAGVDRAVIGFAFVVALFGAATRGVVGVRVMRFGARAGLGGRFVLVGRSVDIDVIVQPCLADNVESPSSSNKSRRAFTIVRIALSN